MVYTSIILIALCTHALALLSTIKSSVNENQLVKAAFVICIIIILYKENHTGSGFYNLLFDE